MFEHFFIYGDVPANVETGAYIPLLVLASYVVAAFGSYTALMLLPRVFNAPTPREKIHLQAVSAFALGSGIWSMHFIGMLAYRMRMEVHYNPWLTGLSMLIAVSVAYSALQIIRASSLSTLRLATCAVLLGLGISAMHYTGMAAMEMDAQLRYIPLFFFLSLAIAMAASGAALWILFYFEQRNSYGQHAQKALAALVMGAAICGMHYTGMEGAVFIPFADCRYNPHQSFTGLAVAVIVITGLIFGITFLYARFRRLLFISFLGLLFALPLVTIVYQAISELNSEVQFAQKEQYGVQYHGDLLRLLRTLQEVRGLSFRVRSGDSAATAELAAKKALLFDNIVIVDQADRDIGGILRVTQAWRAIRNTILPLIDSQDTPTPLDEFRHYSDAIHAVSDAMMDVSDNSNLSLDPQLDTDYLADSMIHSIPDIIQIIGRIRGLTSGMLASGKTPSQWTSEERNSFQALYNELDVQDDDMHDSLLRAVHANVKSSAFLSYHENTVKPQLARFQQHFGRMVFEGNADVSASGMFALASDTISPYAALYDKISLSLFDLVDQREKVYTLKKNLVLFSSVIAFFGFVALFIFLYRNLARTERAERLAIASSQTKSEFLANMSHELRTPLNSILGMARMLSESPLPQEQHELADTVLRSSTNLLEIVNDILDLSKIEAGEMKLEHIGFDLGYVFHSVVHALDHIAKEKRLPVVRNYEKDGFPYLMGDPTRLGRVLTNLVGNAVKYTDKGHVEVRAVCTPLDASHVELRCDITDTGIGIAKEKQQSIFEKFVQADTSTTRKYGGTGLGLAITKQLVEMMGGTIGVTSETGQGSTFWFTIPFEVTDALNEEKHIRKQKMQCGTIPAADACILLAEDHPMNQLFMKKIFKKFGITHVEIVDNGALALDAYRAKPWDVILMDCHMPEKNGYETTREIRELEKGSDRHVPIVAMTANAMVGDKEKCLRYGMDEYVSKPVNIDELKEVLSQWLRFEDAVAGSAAPAPSSGPAPLDMAQLRVFSDGDKTAEKELVSAFVGQSEKNLKALEEAHAANDHKKWSESAHMFKGGAGGVGAAPLSQLCQEAQHFSGTDTQRAALLAQIREEYGRVKNFLKSAELLA